VSPPTEEEFVEARALIEQIRVSGGYPFRRAYKIQSDVDPVFRTMAGRLVHLLLRGVRFIESTAPGFPRFDVRSLSARRHEAEIAWADRCARTIQDWCEQRESVRVAS
jgi:hypothetical protein